jgi:nicotinamidase-related amidase
VLDAFSHACFADALELWPIEPSTVATDLDLIAPDLVLVESAWQGNDGAWVHQLTGGAGPKPAIVRLVQEAKRRGIPTVFWNKEDPPHFDDFLRVRNEVDPNRTFTNAYLDRVLG